MTTKSVNELSENIMNLVKDDNNFRVKSDIISSMVSDIFNISGSSHIRDDICGV